MTPELEHALRATHDVALKLRERRDALRQALERGDSDAVLRYARELLGVGEDEAEGDRPPTRIERGSGGS